MESCVSVIKLYNTFIENNNHHIGEINANFEKLWVDFESCWMKWNNKEIVIWFKYKTMEMNQDDIKWDEIEKELESRNVSGKSLSKFNDLTFEFIGLKNCEMVSYLVKQVEILKRKYNEQDNV